MPCYKNIVYGPSADDTLPDPLFNVILPHTGKPKLSCRPKYADDGVNVAYYEYVLSVDTFIYAANTVLPDIENEVQRIRNILVTPRLQLKIYPVGLGTFPTINTPSYPDLIGGPFPSNVSVEPVVTNQGISIQWEVTFGIAHCSPYFIRQLVQFNSELDVDVDDEGNLSFRISATYQAKDPISDLHNLTAFSNNLVRTATKAFQGMKRQKRTSFSRDRRTVHIEVRYSEVPSDSPYHPYVRNIELEDEMSSSLLEDNMLQGSGFYTWDRSISGSITLPPRVPKIWAWYVFQAILQERLKGMQILTKVPGLAALAQPPNQAAAQPAGVATTKAWYLLTQIRFLNRPYTRVMDFAVQYLVCCSLKNILEGSANVFYNVRANVKNDGGTLVFQPEYRSNGTFDATYLAAGKSEEWLLWEQNTDISLAGPFRYNSTVPVVVAQCDVSSTQTVPTPTTVSPTVLLTGSNELDPAITPYPPQTTTPSAADTAYREVQLLKGGDSYGASKTWLKYDNAFEIIEETGNEHVTYLQDTPIQSYQAEASNTATNQDIAFNVNSRSDNPDVGLVFSETLVYAPSTYKIRMKGSAVRVGEKIPIPALISAMGSTVSRTGTPRFSHQTISVGSQVTNPDAANAVVAKQVVHLAMWDITYSVDTTLKATSSTDLLSQLLTSGDPAHYS